ncbi:nucleoside/nucleotide kinase family protein [Kineococcus sp. SYSU DK003]|uniref:dephospho-CoA kinase n=1 Tax=Kineococcus sp. SYSU DK003 TaxID=3383124 RepID=UPI003D7CF9E3
MVLTLRSTAAVVDEVVALLAAVPVPPAGPTVVAIDGRSGSGKTDLAAALAARTGASVVHMDDLYPGWDGLAAGVELLGGVLAGLRSGAPTTRPVWDWTRQRYTREVPLPTHGVLVVEGVGAGCAGAVDLLVELVAGPALRRDRALARDGATFAPHWESWAAQETELFAREPLRPDVVFTSDTGAGGDPAWR